MNSFAPYYRLELQFVIVKRLLLLLVRLLVAKLPVTSSEHEIITTLMQEINENHSVDLPSGEKHR